MDKQKQMIEEMAKDMFFEDYAIVIIQAKSTTLSDNTKKYCQRLIEEGYRKIPEGAVVLTREEYEKVKHVLKYEPEEAIIRLEDLKKNEVLYSPHMFCSLGGCSGVGKSCNRTCKESWIVIERKETAEKIMNDISGDVLVVDTKEYGRIEVVPFERLNEICEEFMEGV